MTALAIRVMIVDDEPLARRGIRARLRCYEGMDVIGECATGREAVHAIRRTAPDLVFLDVQMPDLSGFDVIRDVGSAHMPVTVFVTAYDEHALRAFDAQALDYLLKPIDDDRFAQTVARIRQRVQERRLGVSLRQATALAGENAGTGTTGLVPVFAARDGRLLLHDRGRVFFVDVGDVDWIESDGDYVRVHAGRHTHLVRVTMQTMERTLDPDRFARIHRSSLVNLSKIVELRPHTSREWTVVLNHGVKLRLSRRYRARLAHLFRPA